MLDAYGPSYASELNFSEREGRNAARIIGSGQQLIDMLERHDAHGSTRAQLLAPIDVIALCGVGTILRGYADAHKR